MGSSSLNTASTWTRAQSTVGNVEINTDYQWVKVKGDGTWGDNAARGQATYSRVNGRALVVDVYAPATATSGQGVNVEWNDGGGFAQTNGKHRVELGSGFAINVKESNVTLSSSATWTKGCIYRIKITLGTTGATYQIQGGKEYPAIGSASWTTLSAPGSSGSTTPLTPSFGAWGSHDYYVSDVRIVG
jgi:hypothetical protein